MENVNYNLLIIASLCTFLGLFLYLYSNQVKQRYFYTFNVVSWIFIPVLPIFFIYLVFPDPPGQHTEGELFNFKLTGVFASYILLWFGGITLTNRGAKIDQLRRQVKNLEEKCQYVKVINDTTAGIAPRPIIDSEVYRYKLKTAKNKEIGLITGDLANVKNVDIWVNSENTNMQMARFGEKSISSFIRYLGAKKHEKTMMVREDTIANNLRSALGNITLVAPATVLATGPGELGNTNGVKQIFHVASVDGQPGGGYKPITRIQDCISNCLIKADSPKDFPDKNLHTILFTLMGTGTGGGELDETVEKLIKTAINYLEQNQETTAIQTVYFLAYTDRDLAACRKVLLECGKASLIEDESRA